MNKGNHENNQMCELAGCLFFSTTKLARELGKIAEEAFSKTGLSPSHVLLLYIINEKEEIQQKEIGELLHLTPSTITRLLDKLDRIGLVSKVAEGKAMNLHATSKGVTMQKEIKESWERLRDAYQDILTTEETAEFIQLSEKLASQLEDKRKHG